MFNEYDSVKSAEDLDARVPAGTRGVIVMVYPELPSAYEVEFVDDEGGTLAVLTVQERQIRRVI